MNNKHAKKKNGIIDSAREILMNKNDFVILDTETTGLGDNDVIIQIGVIDIDGNVLMDTLVRPTKRKRISRDATAIHGITSEMLKDVPTFAEIFPKLCQIIGNKKICIYNANYDFRLMHQTANQDGVRLKDFTGICIMIAYSTFVGEWSEYHKDYKYQKLPTGDHSAIGDCRATLEIIKIMANAEKTPIPKKWWKL